MVSSNGRSTFSHIFKEAADAGAGAAVPTAVLARIPAPTVALSETNDRRSDADMNRALLLVGRTTFGTKADVVPKSINNEICSFIFTAYY
jgi:hypothetical protein